MANTNAPRGLVPYRRNTGAPYNSSGNLYWIPSTYATALYIGDPVQIVAGSSDLRGIPQIQLITAGNGTDATLATYGLIGSIAGRVPGGSPQVPVLQNNPVYIPGSSTGGTYVLVNDDPDNLYVVQANTDWNTAPYAAGSILGPGKNVDLVSGAGSTTTGYSGWVLGATLSTSVLQMKVMRLLDEGDNDLGLYSKWLCRVNLNQLTSSTGT